MVSKSTTHSSMLLPAGILPTVLIICLVIAFFASALIGLAYFRHQLRVRDMVFHQLKGNAKSSVNYLLGNTNIKYHHAHQFDLYVTGNDSVQVEKHYWGLFDLIKASAFRGVHHTSIYALVGKKPDAWGVASLYLADENRPLSLAGSTVVNGTCFLPQAGVRTAYVEGKGFTGKDLIKGEVKTSKVTLPALPGLLVERLRHYGRVRETILPNSVPLRKLVGSTSVSFKAPPLQVQVPDGSILDGVRLSGNVMLISQGEIIIPSSAQLEEVLVLARKVTVQGGFTGRLQVLAQDTVIVEAGCRLSYPSSLVAYNQNGKCRVELGEGSTVEGVFLVGSTEHEALNNTAVLHKDALLEGQAYVDGMVELKGHISGTLACRRFFLLTPTTLYENHLLDCEINVQKRSSYFLTSPLLSEARMEIVQWLN